MGGIEFSLFRKTLAEFLETYGEAGRTRLRDRINDQHFSEVLLMSLVRGNRVRTSSGSNGAPLTNLERVTRAHTAIFGGPPNAFANNRSDVRALSWMPEIREMELYNSTKNGAPHKLTSVSKLARRAHKFNKDHPKDYDPEFKSSRPHISSADHLRKKFPSFWEYRLQRNKDCTYDEEIEFLRLVALEEVEIIFRIFGVESQAED